MSNLDDTITSSTASLGSDLRRLPSPERHLSLTPLEMRQARFGTAMRGFDKHEVMSYIEEAAEAFDAALRENERLRQEIARLEGSITQYRDMEGSLKSTLMSAQKVADDMRENAVQEAQRLVREAEGKADLLLQKAQARSEDIEREIDGLRIKRREAESTVEATIAALNNTLDFIREQDRRERDQRVVPHRSPLNVASLSA